MSVAFVFWITFVFVLWITSYYMEKKTRERILATIQKEIGSFIKVESAKNPGVYHVYTGTQLIEVTIKKARIIKKVILLGQQE